MAGTRTVTWTFTPGGTTVRYVNCDQWITKVLDDMGWGSYSTGGGAVAPVPQGPQGAAAAASTDPEVKAYVSCELAATDALKHFEQPNPTPWFHCKVAAGERPVTSDTLYAAIVKAAPTRTKKFRLAGLNVGLRWAHPSGVTFTVEGLITE